MTSAVPFGVAALIACFVAVVDYRAKAKAPATAEDKAWCWWIARLVFESTIAVCAVAIVNAIVDPDTWAPAGLRGLIIGASLPMILRSYLFTIPSSQGEQQIGISYLYDLGRQYLEGRIADIETEIDSRWAQTVAYPQLNQLGWNANTLAFRLLDVARNRLDPADFAQFRLDVTGTLESNSDAARKLRDTIAHARRIRAYSTLRSIVKNQEQPGLGLLDQESAGAPTSPA